MPTDQTLTSVELADIERRANAASDISSYGPIPEHEEPDTWLLGTNGVLFCRVVGVRPRRAEPDAELFATAKRDQLKLIAALRASRELAGEITQQRLNDFCERLRQHGCEVTSYFQPDRPPETIPQSDWDFLMIGIPSGENVELQWLRGSNVRHDLRGYAVARATSDWEYITRCQGIPSLADALQIVEMCCRAEQLPPNSTSPT